MKKFFLFGVGIVLVLIIAFSGCKSTTAEDPCNNQGKLSIVNKLDSTITVNIVQKHQQVPVQKNFTYSFDLEANQVYTISISGPGYSRPDSTIIINPCDNKLMVIQN